MWRAAVAKALTSLALAGWVAPLKERGVAIVVQRYRMLGHAKSLGGCWSGDGAGDHESDGVA